MPVIEIAGKQVHVNEEGFLTEYNEWDEEIAKVLAAQIDVEMTLTNANPGSPCFECAHAHTWQSGANPDAHVNRSEYALGEWTDLSRTWWRSFRRWRGLRRRRNNHGHERDHRHRTNHHFSHGSIRAALPDCCYSDCWWKS